MGTSEYRGRAGLTGPGTKKVTVKSIHNDVMEALSAADFSVLLVVEAVPYFPIKKMSTRQTNGTNNCPLSIV
jgi:hypothetical protein